MQNITIISQTKKRVRFKVCDLHSFNGEEIINCIKKNEFVSKVRINQQAKSIIINHDENVNFSIQDLSQILSQNSKKLAVKKEALDKKELIKAAGTLLATPLIKNDKAKFALTAYATSPLLIDGLKELKNEGLTSRVLEALAVGVSLGRKDYLAANSTNAMLALGEYIEESTVHKSDDLIKELAKPNITEAWVLEVIDGKEVEKKVLVKDLKIGDIVVANAGDTIAVDGHILSGTATINQVSMTGEAEPVIKKRGDNAMSGTIVEEGRIRIWAEQVGENTSTQRIKEYIKASLDEKSSIALKANSLADKLVPVTLGLAGISYALSRNMATFASVLQADYSCALKLATPVAFKSSISKAGKNGILIKGSKPLEALSKVDTIVFDKTGTLTHGDLEVVGVSSFNKEWSEDEILNLTASAEEHYFHPVAEAIVNAAKRRGFVHMHHEEVKFIVAHGVKTIIDKKEVLVGNRHFLEDDNNISFKGHVKEINNYINEGKTLLYVSYDGKLLGTIALVDKVRHNSKQCLSELKKLGVKELIMLTGDIEKRAKMIADEVGIDTVYAELLPTDKAKIVKKLKDEGRNIAFVGDGINDAPALISASVGISMQKGADIAKASADISLLKDDLYAVVEAKRLANETMKKINTNFNLTVGVNSGILLGAATGLFSPITTAVLHNGTTIGLLFNSIKGIDIKKGN